MLKKKIIASSIGNLTDARYFAGWMVDYFVFDIEPGSGFHISPQEIGTFQSWVEGPKYLLKMSSDQLDYSDKFLVDLNCHAVVISEEHKALVGNNDVPTVLNVDFESYKQLSESQFEFPAQVIISEVEKIKDVLDYFDGKPRRYEVFVEMNQEKLTSEQLLESNVAGFVVHGSPEEKVGFKSYDELDEIFEVLQDF